jgi:predicted  nucleic acid-binding Zn-ribbon protein
MERIVITFQQDGTFRGASVADFNGQPKPLDEAALNALFPDVNASSFSRVTTLEEDLSEMTTAKESATTELDTATSRVESLESQLSDTQTQLATAQGEASSVPNLQAQLDTATSRVQSLESQLADTQTQLATAQGEASSVPNLQAQLDTATSRVQSLESQLATAQGEASNVPTLQAQIETALARIAELEAVPEEPVIVGVSKLTIMRRLGDKWPTLKASLLTLPEIVQDAWLLAQEIRADDELFIEFRPQLIEILEMTEEEFDGLLMF